MAASLKAREEAEIKRNRAWELHINGVTQWDIARELGVTQARVSQFIQQAARNHPVRIRVKYLCLGNQWIEVYCSRIE